MPSSINLTRKNGTLIMVPNIRSGPVPQVGETIEVPIGDELVTIRVTVVKRRYLAGDIDNPLHVIKGEEV